MIVPVGKNKLAVGKKPNRKMAAAREIMGARRTKKTPTTASDKTAKPINVPALKKLCKTGS